MDQADKNMERERAGGRENFVLFVCVCMCVLLYFSYQIGELPAPAFISILMLTNKAKCQLRALSR